MKTPGELQTELLDLPGVVFASVKASQRVGAMAVYIGTSIEEEDAAGLIRELLGQYPNHDFGVQIVRGETSLRFNRGLVN